MNQFKDDADQIWQHNKYATCGIFVSSDVWEEKRKDKLTINECHFCGHMLYKHGIGYPNRCGVCKSECGGDYQ